MLLLLLLLLATTVGTSAPPWPPPRKGSGAAGSAGTDVEHVMGRAGPIIDGMPKWVVLEFSGWMSVPAAPAQPQSLNGAGFSIWPGLLVGDKLLQPCLTLHRQCFPGDDFYSRRSDDFNVTDQMAGCCYTPETPYFMALWGYEGSKNVVNNRWIERAVTHLSWSIRESSLANHSFSGGRYDYEMNYQGHDSRGRAVPGATAVAQVPTGPSKNASGARRKDAGKSYGMQLVTEIFSGLPYRDPNRYMEVAWELWSFYPTSNVYVWQLRTVLLNVSEPQEVSMDVHGNPCDPCTGVFMNRNWTDVNTGRRGLSLCYPNNWQRDPECYPEGMEVDCRDFIAASKAHHRPSSRPLPGRTVTDDYVSIKSTIFSMKRTPKLVRLWTELCLF